MLWLRHVRQLLSSSNFIGTDASGTFAARELFYWPADQCGATTSYRGTYFWQSVHRRRDRRCATASGNLIEGNKIGTDQGGTRAVPNGPDGVFINNAPDNMTIGNLISGNASVASSSLAR